MRKVEIVSAMLAGASGISLSFSVAAQAQSGAPVAQATPADQQLAASSARPVPEDDQSASQIVVTGSRVIANGNQAPTPVTVVPTERLLQTAPSSIPDALNRLPQFAAQPSTRNIGNAQGNATGNFLNLRRFGNNRNLILLDGSRLPPTAASGAVDTNTIPQALIQRVEVVTGGASAVYGSDAITGVVNFVLDKKFNGIKASSQIGTSTYGDDSSWRVGIAAGTPIGDRGHIEASFDHYDSKGLIGVDVRKAATLYPTIGGAGTKDNPFRVINYGALTSKNSGGVIIGSSAGGTLPIGLRDITFKQDGVASPFIHGASSGLNGLESGGDGGHFDADTYVAPVRTNQAFGRFDYELGNNLNFYAQAGYSDSFADYPYASPDYTVTILSGNPFIPASVQAAMNANNISSITLGKLVSINDRKPRTNHVFSTNVLAMGGFSGKIGSFDWNVNAIHSVSKQHVRNRNNTMQTRFAAAVDAVVDPATGRVVCQVSLTQYAGLFPGCEPLNEFGPSAATKSSYDWVTQDTFFVLTNKMDDINFSVAGSPIDLWAGPVKLAVSGEYRWASLRNASSVEAAAPPDCTGLRANCSPTTPAWQHDVSSSVFAKQNVKEAAVELLVPLLKDVPLVRSFELNLAGRYTDYSSSGSVKTWKVGANWEIVDGVRARVSRSRDIRAPTLQDLYAPLNLRPSGFTDLHTNQTRQVSIYSQGNPDLKPEVALTTTVGLVLQPAVLRNFSLAIDYFAIKMNNAIVNASGFSTDVQRECENSNGTSLFCSLLERPLPFSDRSPANFPTRVSSQNLNVAKQSTKGVDVEANYRFGLDGFNLPGQIALRALMSYQPSLKRQTVSTVAAVESAGVAGGFSKVRVNASVDYTSGGLSVLVSERWQSKQQPSDRSINYDLRPDIPAYSYTDISVSYQIEGHGGVITPFFTIENLFNKKPPIIGTQNNVPGLFYPTAAGYDIIGRYFTGGVRVRF